MSENDESRENIVYKIAEILGDSALPQIRAALNVPEPAEKPKPITVYRAN